MAVAVAEVDAAPDAGMEDEVVSLAEEEEEEGVDAAVAVEADLDAEEEGAVRASSDREAAGGEGAAAFAGADSTPRLRPSPVSGGSSATREGSVSPWDSRDACRRGDSVQPDSVRPRWRDRST